MKGTVVGVLVGLLIGASVVAIAQVPKVVERPRSAPKADYVLLERISDSSFVCLLYTSDAADE